MIIFKIGIYFSIVGFVIAWIIFAIGWWEDYPHQVLTLSLRYSIAQVTIIVFPTSLALMAIENVHGIGRIILLIILAFQNAALYGLAGALIAYIWQQIAQFQQGLQRK